jgi:hypothetical protein
LWENDELLLLGLLAAVALVVQPPAPPGISAFAPQAAKPITKAPPGQASQNGQGNGACADGLTCARPSPTAKPSSAAGPTASLPPVAAGVPSALQCYTWPDGSVTQTFDPQSPPCIASWPEAAKGNGGATSTGVTATQIRVALPQGTNKAYLVNWQRIVDFFNTHYQLYGRRIVLVPFASKQLPLTYEHANSTAQHADAVEAASRKVFAALDFFDGGSTSFLTQPDYVDELAKRHVISLTGGENAPNFTPAQMRSHAPYEWSYAPTAGATLDATGAQVCRQLAGHNASHATAYTGTRRKFAIVAPDAATSNGPIDGVDRLRAAVARCAAQGAVEVVYYKGYTQTGAADQSLAVDFSQLRDQGVTSLLYVIWSGATGAGQPMQAASQLGWHPEWITPQIFPYMVGGLESGSNDQLPSVFGVGVGSKLLPDSQTPWLQAFQAAGGSLSDASLRGGNTLYHELSLLAAGVQMAGPRLTPETFANALRSTTFPNPGAGTAPSWQAAVGFAEGPTMVNDFNGFWIDPSATSQTFVTSAHTGNLWRVFCYLDVGARWTGSRWPAQDRFKQGRCR